MKAFDIIPEGAFGGNQNMIKQIIEAAKGNGFTVVMAKFLEIESQFLETDKEFDLLNTLLSVAKEAGYTHVKDNLDINTFNEYTIDEAIKKFG